MQKIHLVCFGMVLDLHRLMKHLFYFVLMFPMITFSQVEEIVERQDSIYFIVQGDTVHQDAIDLDEVMLFNRLKFKNRKERIQYLILKRKIKKVYPYAKLATDRLIELEERLSNMSKKSHQKKYAKLVEKYIEEEFSAELKKLSRTEGQILVKLIHRQTGKTTFTLIKELRNRWKAFWYNNTARLFNISLKKEYNPIQVEEDFLIEDILQREFQNGQLEKQKPELEFDYFDLADKWYQKRKE